jgi:hypothetical protein
MNPWDLAATIYGAIALITFLPVILPMIWSVKLKPASAPSDKSPPADEAKKKPTDQFDKSPHFSAEAKQLLNDHYSRIHGTLGFWKTHAAIYKRFHYYCICWTIISSWLVPLLGTIGVEGAQRWLIVAVSSHVALALSFHRGLKVPDQLRAYRLGESEFYDIYRRLLDRPEAFGKTEKEQLTAYFTVVEDIRRRVRSAEADSMPNIEQVTEPNKQSLHDDR